MQVKKRKARDTIKVRGFCRVQIRDHKTGKVVGDSGWGPNTVTDFGLDNACAGAMIGAAGSCQALSGVIATQSTAVDATQISLLGTQGEVVDLSPSTIVTGTAQVTASFAGSDLGGTITVGSVGLHSNTNAATDLVAGKTFTTSQMATNQDLDITYQIQFS
jgi:hypothetical protein